MSDETRRETTRARARGKRTTRERRGAQATGTEGRGAQATESAKTGAKGPWLLAQDTPTTETRSNSSLTSTTTSYTIVIEGDNADFTWSIAAVKGYLSAQILGRPLLAVSCLSFLRFRRGLNDRFREKLPFSIRLLK